MPKEDHLSAWDLEYINRGRLWAGAGPSLPSLPMGTLVLELGCGNGKTLTSMIRQGWRIVALDQSPQAVNLSRELLSASEQGSKVDLLVAQGCVLPFCFNSFDAIFAFHIFGHLWDKERRQMTSEVERVLRPNGKLFFRDFSVEDMRYGRGEMVEANTFRRSKGTIIHYFIEREMMDLFSSLRLNSCFKETWTLGRVNSLQRSELVAEFTKIR
jgi:SAM-dependent methyltransferase